MKTPADDWRELCIAAAFEHDPERLGRLVTDIKDQLRDRQEELTDRIFEGLVNGHVASSPAKEWIH
jgi:hypothetical protein